MIDKKRIEQVLMDQKGELEMRRGEKLCHRREVEQIDMESPQAQVVIGVRRSGKSTLCFQALERAGVKYAYMDFDDERLMGVRAEDLNDVLEVAYKVYGEFRHLFMDEVQNVDGWHLFVNRLLRSGMRVILTGSNAKLLGGDLATHLTGRSKEIALYPFSFGEFCTMKGVDTEGMTTKLKAFRRGAFDEYMRRGGFPEMMAMSDSRTYVRDLVKNILQRDVQQRFSVTFRAAFEQLASHVMNIAPGVVDVKEMAEMLKIRSEHTVKNYIDYLKQAYLLIGLQKYSQKSKLRMTQEKEYTVDVALMDGRENAMAGENLGWRLETVVCVELMRRCRARGYDVYYLRERQGECDFVVCRGKEVVEAIQVSYDISNEKTRRREMEGLMLAKKRTGCGNLLLLTDWVDEDVEWKGEKVRVRPVCEWVLEG